MRHGLFFVGSGLAGIWVLMAPGAATAPGARGHDCGPEPSLRTAPLSSSSAFGSLQIPSGASTALAPPVPATRCCQGLWYVAL